MRYRLRTLLIVLALGPPVIAIGWAGLGGIAIVLIVAMAAGAFYLWAATQEPPTQKLIEFCLAVATAFAVAVTLWALLSPLHYGRSQVPFPGLWP